MSHKLCLLSFGTLPLLVASNNAAAQTVPVENEIIELDPFVVQGFDPSSYSSATSTTATRIEVDHNKLPLLINTVSHYLLDEQNTQDPSEAFYNISSTQAIVGTPGFANQVTIRGFNSFTYIDGFRVGYSNGNTVDGISLPTEIATLDRIEVLKGPSATLYGRGLPGGVINFITKKPSAFLEGSIKTTIGSYDFYKATADITGPISDDRTLNYRMIAASETSESYRDFVEQDLTSFFPSLQWDLSETASLLVRGEFRTGSTTPDRGVLFLPNQQPNFELQPTLAPFSSQSSFYGTDLNNTDFEQTSVNADFTSEITDDWKLHALLGTRFYRQNGTEIYADTFNNANSFRFPISNTPPTGPDEVAQFRNNELVRFRYESIDKREDYLGQIDNFFTFEHDFFDGTLVEHRLLLGTDWQFNRSNSIETQFGFDQFDPNSGTATTTTTTLANIPVNVFDLGPYTNNALFKSNDVGFTLQDNISINNKLHFLLGLRFEHSELDLQFQAPISPISKLKLTRNEWMARTGMIYQANKAVAVFANYGESYRPTISVSGTGRSFLDAQLSDQYEVGLKLNFLDERLLINTAGFIVSNNNVRRRVGSDSSGNALFDLLSQDIFGYEIDMTAKLTKRLTLLANYGYLDSKLKGNPLVDDNRISGTPEHSAGIWSNYDLIQSETENLSLSLGLEHKGSVFASDANQLKLPSASIVNAGIHYRKDRWSAQLNLYNLTDELYFTASPLGSAGDPIFPIYALPAAPFEARFSVKYKF